MRTVTFGAADVVSPVFAAAEIVPFFFAGVAAQASLRDFLRGFAAKRDDLGLVATAIDVRFARTVT